MHALFNNLILSGRLNGRTSRKNFATAFILYILISIIITLLYMFLLSCNVNSTILTCISKFKVFFTCLFGIATLSMSIRRFHDTNRTGWNFLWLFFPIIGWTIFLIFLFDRPYNEDNKYPEENIKPNYSFFIFTLLLCILIAINSKYDIQNNFKNLEQSYTELTTPTTNYINNESIDKLTSDSDDYNFVGTWLFEKETQQGIFVQKIEITENKTFTYNCGYKKDFLLNKNLFYLTGDISIKHNKMILTLKQHSDACSYTFTNGDTFNCYLLNNSTLLVDMFDNGYITTYTKSTDGTYTIPEEIINENQNIDNTFNENTISEDNSNNNANNTTPDNTVIPFKENNEFNNNINSDIYDTLHQFETQNTVKDFYF